MQIIKLKLNKYNIIKLIYINIKNNIKIIFKKNNIEIIFKNYFILYY